MKKVSIIMAAILLIAGLAFGAALTKDRNTPARDGNSLSIGVAVANTIYAGGMVGVNSGGYAVPVSASTGITVIGRAEEQENNSTGANGAKTVTIGTGIYRYANGTFGNAVSDDDIGKIAYAKDDQTVWVTDSSGTLPPAGRVYDVDSSGVWVDFSGNLAIGSVTRNFLGSGILPTHRAIVCNTTASEIDDDSSVTETLASIPPSAIVIAVVNSSTNIVFIRKAYTTAGIATFLINGVGGEHTTINYCIFNAVQ